MIIAMNFYDEFLRRIFTINFYDDNGHDDDDNGGNDNAEGKEDDNDRYNEDEGEDKMMTVMIILRLKR